MTHRESIVEDSIMNRTASSPEKAHARNGRRRIAVLALACLGFGLAPGAHAEVGVTDSVIRIGGVMDLKGDSRDLGQDMKAGIEAALRNRRVQGRRFQYVTLDDGYSPRKTVESTKKLVSEGVFAMLGNVGTPTAKVSLPILAEHGVPAIGFFTGAGLLRPGRGDIVNFRASYVQETAAVIQSALAAGAAPSSICAYVQNDAYGMAGVAGIKRVLARRQGMEEVTASLDAIMAMTGENPARNNLGPVGVYQRNTLYSRDGYESLKRWEERSGVPCSVVVSVGTYQAVARFAAYARFRGEQWIVSAVSFTGADSLRAALHNFDVEEGIIMTQVVPPLDADLAIVKEAKKALGPRFGYVSLEGYIVGKMFLAAMARIKGPLTRKAFLEAIKGKAFDLGGMVVDFSTDNQGSDFVHLTYLGETGYRSMGAADWSALRRK